MRKVVLIGLDSAVPRFVFDQWGEDVPHLRSLREDGAWGEIRSTHPPITVPAWTSMLASRDPGELGCYGFRNRRSYAYDDYAFATSRQVGHDRVWDVLSRAGRKVIVLGVPQTYPPRPLNGCMVSCFLTPSRESEYTYPRELKEEVERAANGYVFDVENFRTADKQGLLERIYEKTRKHFAVARHLMATKPWDLFAMVEMGVDRIQHGFWKYCDPAHPKYEAGHPLEDCLRQYYRYVDAEIGELLSGIDAEATVLVVSDHGARPMEGAIGVNEWLLQRGDLRLQRDPGEPTALSPRLVDWEHTRIWGEGGYCGRLFLNVRGREPRGQIDPRDYERVRDDLIAAVEQIDDAGGRPMGSRAYRPEELYAEVNGIAPDLLVYFGDLRWRSIGSVGRGAIHSFDNDTGPDDANHDWNGIFLLRDGRRGGGGRLEGLQLMDVAPTILEQLDVEIPEAMRGRTVGSGAKRRPGREP